MSIALIVSEVFGNGTFVGTIPDIVTVGYNISTIIPPTVPDADGIVAAGVLGNGISANGELGDGIASNSNLGDGLTSQGSL